MCTRDGANLVIFMIHAKYIHIPNTYFSLAFFSFFNWIVFQIQIHRKKHGPNEKIVQKMDVQGTCPRAQSNWGTDRDTNESSRAEHLDA